MCKVSGRFAKFLWRDDISGSSLISLIVNNETEHRDPQYGTIVVSACTPVYDRSLPLTVEGEWISTDRGMLLKAKRIYEEAWNAEVAADYLSNVSGFGKTRSAQVTDQLGPNIFSYMADIDAPEKLCNICRGLSMQAALEACRKVRNVVAQRQLFEYVQRFGGNYKTASRLFKEHGPDAISLLKSRPFEIGHEYGFSFRKCDEIALSQGMDRLDPMRVLSAAIEVIAKNEQDGNCFLKEDEFVRKTEHMLSGNWKERLPDGLITSLAYADKRFSVEEAMDVNRVYSKTMMRHECNIAWHIARLQHTRCDLPFDESVIAEIEKEIGVEYAPQQREAFRLLHRTGVSIVTGGPGTGKTTVINGIIRAYKRMCPNNTIRCCAPTGRASQRMRESTGEESVTVHKLLEYKPYGNDVAHKDMSNPIEADFVIMDEASMLDTELASLFLTAIKNGTLVLFVGDVDQLQAVGPGDVLHNLIFSKRIDVHRLTAVYRQATTSPIVQNAIKINTGDASLVRNEEFEISYHDPEMFPDEIIKAVRKYHDPKDPFRTQVLSPTKKGPHGVFELNETLQGMLNPRDQRKRELKYGVRKVFREGDKVVMTQNNYRVGYHNGDIGIIHSIEGGVVRVNICGGDPIEVTDANIDDMMLAYVMTVHKSQGSEFQNVILSLPYKPEIMLKRNLLYTGITRAKQMVLIIAESRAVETSIARDETGKRNTFLLERLQISIPPEE